MMRKELSVLASCRQGEIESWKSSEWVDVQMSKINKGYMYIGTNIIEALENLALVEIFSVLEF